jgi:two-component system response regulator HydG
MVTVEGVRRGDGTRRVLVVDDDPAVLRSVTRVLERSGFEPFPVGSGREAFAAIAVPAHAAPDVVLTDLHLQDTLGLEVVAAAAASHPSTAAIVMTGQGTIASAVEAMRRGAFDYLVKPFEQNEILVAAVERALAHKRLVERNRYLEQRLVVRDRYEDLVGGSAAMRAAIDLADTVAPLDVTVLVLGESGTGKELIVRAIHRRSRRRDKPFVAVNCGALAESVLESELFGHAKGAFTGAVSARRGLFEEASGGTVFLDEVGELPPSVQVRLLRVLQEREVRPVGSNRSEPVDVRVIAATNRDLSADVAEGKFRGDLFYRLNVVSIAVPPLRARMEDVPLLAHHFVGKHAARHGRNVEGIDPEAMAALCAHDWPGNVRELENAIERGVVLSAGPRLTQSSIAASVKGQRASDVVSRDAGLDPPDVHGPLAQAKHDFERNYLKRALARAQGNLTEVARSSGLDRSNLKRLLRRYELDASADEKTRSGSN